MSPSISRRSRLMPSSVRASSSARAGVVGQQAFDAQRHVGQPAGGVDARARAQSRSRRWWPLAALRAGHAEQRRHARRQGAGAHALEALRHQAAVVGVELDHVGHGAQRDQRQQGVELGLCLRASNTPRCAQLGAQRQQHVEHHADTGDRLALEAAAGLVGVDDAPSASRQLPARGQVVVGHQHLQAQRARGAPRRPRWRCRCPP